MQSRTKTWTAALSRPSLRLLPWQDFWLEQPPGIQTGCQWPHQERTASAVKLSHWWPWPRAVAAARVSSSSPSEMTLVPS